MDEIKPRIGLDLVRPMEPNGGGAVRSAAPIVASRNLVASPANPDTFTGLLSRLDTHLQLLEELETKLEIHADKLVPKGSERLTGERSKGGEDDSASPVIVRLQRRADRLAGLVDRMKQHQGRADRVF